MQKTSVALISSYVGKNPADITYSFVFDEAYQLAKRGVSINVIRSIVEKSSFSYGLHFYGLKRKLDLNAFTFSLRNLNLFSSIFFSESPFMVYWENQYASAVSKVVERTNVDLIHAHFAYPEGVVGWLVKRRTKKPLVITVHGYDILVEPSVGYGVRLNRKTNIIIGQVLNNADAIIAASNEALRECLMIVENKSKVHLMPNGVDLQKFNPAFDSLKIREKLGFKDKFVVFTLRSHDRKYGIEYLIRAAPLVKKHADNVVFVIGGDGPLRSYHQQLASELGVGDIVFFTSRIPQDEVPSYYAMSDIVVVPSLQEAFGLVVTEAMASGKPVIGTNVGGIPDQIVDGYNGFLVPTKDPSGIADKILCLISNPKMANLMGIKGREVAEKNFNIETRVDKILALYREVLAR